MGALELGERSLLLVGALAVLERACLGGERRLRLGRVLVVLKHGVGLGRVTVHRVGVGLVCEQMPARVRCSCGRPGTTLREVGASEQVVMWWEATPARDRTRARRERCVRERARSAARRRRRPGCVRRRRCMVGLGELSIGLTRGEAAGRTRRQCREMERRATQQARCQRGGHMR